MTYKIECGAFVTKFVSKIMTIEADDIDDAITQAVKQFEIEVKEEDPDITDVGDINIDGKVAG